LVVVYVLSVANLILAWSEFTFGHPGATLAARVAFGLGYALVPVILGFGIALLITKHSSGLPPRHHSPFLLNLEISWSLFLLVAAFTHIASMDH
jgi:hypothetical protein